MRIYLRRHAHRGVTKAFRYDLQRNTADKYMRRVGVTQRVQAHAAADVIIKTIRARAGGLWFCRPYEEAGRPS
jgi:hypothetical protein